MEINSHFKRIYFSLFQGDKMAPPARLILLMNFSNLNTNTDKSLPTPLPERTHFLPKLSRSLPSVAKTLLQFHLSCDVYRQIQVDKE